MEATKVVPHRVGAFLIDSLALSALASGLFWLLADPRSEILDRLALGEETATLGNIGEREYAIAQSDTAIFFLVLGIFGIAYFWVLPGLKGWTLGKLALGLRVVKDDGSCPAGVGKNAVRSLLWIVDAFPYLIPNLTGFVVALANDRNKRVGDMVAGTLVVKQERLAGAPAGFAPQPGFAQPPAAAPMPTAQPAAASQTPAGWYQDPQGEKRLRYWDGSAWTGHTAD